MDSIEVNYTLGDMYSVTMQSWRRLLFRIVVLIGILVAVFIALPMVLDRVSFRESVSWFPWNFYLGLTAFLVFFLFGVCPLIAYFRSKRNGDLGPNRLKFSDEGVRIESPKGESLVYWK